MDKKKIEKQYNLKIREFVRLNKFYYQYSKPAVKDEEFDKLKGEILTLENQHKFLKSKNSPSKIVGFKPAKTFKKALHKVPMLRIF